MIDMKLLKSMAQDISILYIENEDNLRDSLGKYLKKIFNHVTITVDGQKGFNFYQKNHYDIVITDIEIPIMNGLEMAKKIKNINSDQEIIIISAYSDSTYFIDAIRLGISDYVIKPINFAQINQVIHKSILNLSNFKEKLDYKINLEKMIEKRTNEALILEKEKVNNFEMTLESFASLVEERDNYTGAHSQRVANYSRLIAQQMQYSKEDCDLVYRAGMLHDIGKVTTPDAILLKPKRLTELELKIIHEHVTESYNILIKIPMYKDIADIIICHHERYDGGGYPNGLKAKIIPPLSRIMIVADAFDAMTTNRIYKTKMSVENAIKEMIELSGAQFDPEVVSSATKALKDIKIVETSNQLPHTQVEKERFAYFFRDHITNTYNIDYLNFTLNRNSLEEEYICVNVFYLHNFNQYNLEHGWIEGDKLLSEVAHCLIDFFPSSLIFRIHGDDFIIMSKEHIELNLEDIRCIDIFRKNNIHMSKRHLDLKKENISNFKELEDLMLICKK